MRRTACIVCLLCFLICCGPKQDKVERIIEDGIEVLLNHNISQTELTPLRLEKKFSIDTEAKAILDFGLTDIWGFDVSPDGEIFVYHPPSSQGNLIFRFNKVGAPILAFGKKGQGPAEIQYPRFQKVISANEINVVDRGSQKLLVFDNNGGLLSESKPELRMSGVMVCLELSTGNYFLGQSVGDISDDSMKFAYSITDSEFNTITALGVLTINNPITSQQFKYPFPVLSWGLSDNQLFIGSEENGYDIHVYDFNGRLIRKIRKNFTSVPYSEEQRNDVLKRMQGPEPEFLRNKIVFPGVNPPFQHLFVSNDNILFVMTFEPGIYPGEYMTDVFNADGELVSRISINIWLSGDILQPGTPFYSWSCVLNNRLYCIREKESGHKVLIAYEMLWE